jgi:hypothetical protein
MRNPILANAGYPRVGPKRLFGLDSKKAVGIQLSHGLGGQRGIDLATAELLRIVRYALTMRSNSGKNTSRSSFVTPVAHITIQGAGGEGGLGKPSSLLFKIEASH